jgi:putative nucleotidyltransferase with HDIG domain
MKQREGAKKKWLLIIGILFLNILQALTPKEITDNLFALLNNAAKSDYIGESISQLDHALQAAHLASKYIPYDEKLIIAALFHDVAHRLKDSYNLDGNQFGVFNHGPIGAVFLSKMGFSDKICTLVREHATAKRYLARESKYHAKLSYASQQTLIHQGGIMTDEQAKIFEHHPYFKELIAIRLCDDAAKDPYAKVPGLEYYRNMIEQHLINQI